MQLDTVMLVRFSKIEKKTIRTITKHKINFINNLIIDKLNSTLIIDIKSTDIDSTYSIYLIFPIMFRLEID